MLKRKQLMTECQAVVDKLIEADNLGLDDPLQQQSIDDAFRVLWKVSTARSFKT